MTPTILKAENSQLLQLHNDKRAKEIALVEAKAADEKESISAEIAKIDADIQELEAVIAKQVAEWKAKYGTVHEIVVADKKLYLKKFDRHSLSLALGFMGRDAISFAETLVSNNIIGGDSDIIEDTDYLPGIADVCLEIVNNVRTAYVKH